MDLAIYSMLGLGAGALASFVLKTRSVPGFVMDLLLGLFGAMTGGIVMYLLGQSEVIPTGYDLYSIALAVIGAVVWIGVGNQLQLDKSEERIMK